MSKSNVNRNVLVLAEVIVLFVLALTFMYRSTLVNKQSALQKQTFNKILVKEWGVSLNNPLVDYEPTYFIENFDKDGAQRLHFSYKKLIEYDEKCSGKNSIDAFGLSALGTLIRLTPSSFINLPDGKKYKVEDINTGRVNVKIPQDYKRIGDNYYKLTQGYTYGDCGKTQEAMNFLNKDGSYISRAFMDPAIQDSLQEI